MTIFTLVQDVSSFLLLALKKKSELEEDFKVLNNVSVLLLKNIQRAMPLWF